MKTLASASQRFLAFVIDGIIISFFSFIVALLLGLIFSLEEPILQEPSDDVKSEVIIYINDYLSEVLGNDLLEEDADINLVVTYFSAMDEEDVTSYFSNYINYDEILSFYNKCIYYQEEYTKYTIYNLLVTLLSYFIIMIIYYDIIGYLWKHQTIGRLIMKIKVVTYDGSDITPTKLLLRDFVGFGLFNLLNVCCGLALIINWYKIYKQNVSVGDAFSQTRMIRYDKAAQDYEKSMNNNMYKSDINFSKDDTYNNGDTEVINIKPLYNNIEESKQQDKNNDIIDIDDMIEIDEACDE